MLFRAGRVSLLYWGQFAPVWSTKTMDYFWDGGAFVRYFRQGVDNKPPSAPAASVVSSLFSALPRVPRAHSCPEGGAVWNEWVRALEFVFTAFLVGVLVGCLGGGVVRTAFWFQLMPLVFGACLVCVAVYII